MECAYQRVLPEKLLARFGKIHGRDRDLPSRSAAANICAQSPCDDLMPKTHSDGTLVVVIEDPSRKVDKSEDPRCVVKRVKPCHVSDYAIVRAVRSKTH